MTTEQLKWLFSIGTISFFEDRNTFHWKDFVELTYHGPYSTLNEAVKDCQSQLREKQKPKLTSVTTIPNDINIIPVNFTTKKRI